jgi:hypothetical protein
MSDTINFDHAVKGSITESTPLTNAQFANAELIKAIRHFERLLKIPGYEMTPLEYIGFQTLVKLYESQFGNIR